MTTTGELDLLLPHLSEIRVPTQHDKIFKDECMFSFDTPDSPEGIFVSMQTFLGLGRKFVPFYYEATKNAVYLNIRRIAQPKKMKETTEDEDPKTKITKLAINVEGGFQTNESQIDYIDENRIVIMPDFQEISLSSKELPEKVIMAVTGILSYDSASKQEEILATQNMWDGEERKVSKHAENLEQLPNGVKVPPLGWKCQKCDIREGLWLNLTDGAIMCGRRYFDGTGGNNHASEHYDATKYPLVVKLGTITPNGADVYSYDEDSMVLDPNLPTHLAHFGISISNCQKTEKSMAEMEIDLNKRYDEWSIIQEDGCELKSVFGPGFTGIANLGNSCYLNSIVQMLFSIDRFIETYYRPSKMVQFRSSNILDPAGDLMTQLIKLACGLQSGEYSCTGQNINEQVGIKPQMFKNLIGRNHAEFKSKRQQDAQEFFLYLIDMIERLHHSTGDPNGSPTDCFKFDVEQRIECGTSHQVQYQTRCEFLLSLSISEVPIQNQQEYNLFLEIKEAVEREGGKVDSQQIVRPVIKLTDCIEHYTSPVRVDDFYSTAINSKTFANLTSRMKTFPDYLVIHMKKFTLDPNWVPVKLDVNLEVPDELDIEHLRSKGKQPDEVELPDNSSKPDASQSSALGSTETSGSFAYDMNMLRQLVEMGFPENGCKRALFHTKNSGIEAASSWLFENVDDTQLMNSPFEAPTEEATSGDGVDPKMLVELANMGFGDKQARIALYFNRNQTEAAIDWLFSNNDQIEHFEQEMNKQLADKNKARAASHTPASPRDGPGKYELVAFVSHMGSSTFCGHYVVHIKKSLPDGAGHQWVIFNDNKVAISERPPKQFGYMYLYRRITPSH